MDYKVKLKNIHESCALPRTPKDAQSFLAAEISKNFFNQDFIFIASSENEMEEIYRQLKFFSPESEILNFYGWDCLPYDRASPKPLILGGRIKTLHQLVSRKVGQNFFIITSVNAILQKIIPPSQIKNSGLFLQTKGRASIEEISAFLVTKGYRREACANDAGEFAVRGGIIDIVIQEMMEVVGYRIDFFGDEVESIKVFDPITQISNESIKTLEILPASEVVLNKKTVENFRQNYRKNFGASMFTLFRGNESTRQRDDGGGASMFTLFRGNESTRQRDDGGGCSIDDQLYAAISESRSYIGMEHWLPFFYEENLVSFFDYTKNPVVFFGDQIFGNVKHRSELISEYYQARIMDLKNRDSLIYNPIPPELLYFSEAEFKQNLLEKNITIEFKNFDSEEKNRRILDLELKPTPDFALAGRTNSKDPIELLKNFLSTIYYRLSTPLLISCLTQNFCDRIKKIFLDYGIPCEEVENFEKAKEVKAGKAAIFVMPTHFGFYSTDFILIGEQALFGEKIIRKKQSSKAAAQRIIEEGMSINLGELVVHRDHGIGKFDGIHLISAGGIKTDLLKILYGANDTLFVPVDDINLITRYGADNPLIQLDRLGVSTWKNRREKVKKRIKVAAEELLKIAAARHLKKAPIFVADQHFYDEFRSGFGFVETEDQLRAIEEVEEDLRRGSPMDRLVCGDVGFGKTEVAMRATALVVSHKSKVESQEDTPLSTIDYRLSTNPQVAIITPTTLLCRQHYKNFTQRFAGTDVKVVQLSRLITAAQAKEVRAQIESGEAQIIIGTHALLQKTIKFKNLALAIVDEEQHFGVAQKERLKELRNEVHMLTLSATPIPRTLQMSLTGVKDLSLISTPPLDRLAVRNFVMPYDSVIVREAVMREFNRGGRIFFVVPRIRDIEEMEPRLKILLPEIKITHAHGQMTPTELENIMNDFVDGKIDMLLSTTIIESGIDISQANSMIIYRADMFGLSQLYQLRGRVGRAKVRAYCYFMLDNRKRISEETKKKLEVIQNLDSLGIGFTVASHDMDIRGSGNLLGDEQSGHIKETGVELYQQMLLETIENLKNNSEAPTLHQITDDLDSDFSISIKLGISLIIPEEYMSDLSLRMSFYKKIAVIRNKEDEENLINMMADRFGKIPPEVLNLIKIANLKHDCKKIGVERLEVTKDGILISFKNNQFANPDKLLAMIFSSTNKIKLQAGQRVLFAEKFPTEESKISGAFAVIKKLEAIL